MDKVSSHCVVFLSEVSAPSMDARSNAAKETSTNKASEGERSHKKRKKSVEMPENVKENGNFANRCFLFFREVRNHSLISSRFLCSHHLISVSCSVSLSFPLVSALWGNA